jgi:polyhydroxyalkanoate synthesis repressor PhaR
MANSDRPTIIEKYANRRLYNTGTFTFVTLDELAAMVKRGKTFLVYDAKTGADITNRCWRTSSLNRKTPTAHESHTRRS